MKKGSPGTAIPSFVCDFGKFMSLAEKLAFARFLRQNAANWGVILPPGG